MNLKLAKKWLDSKEFEEACRERIIHIREAAINEGERKRMLARFKEDPVYFIETFGWTLLTDLNSLKLPFFLWDYQKDILWKLVEAEGDTEHEHEILIDKPRKMGVTWVVVWYMVWRWLFTPGWSAFVLSRTETEVDAGDADPASSLFGKVRWSFNLLPDWLMPSGYSPKGGQRGTTTDRNLKILNPDKDSMMVGSTTNSNAGRSRRYSFTFVDEAFAIEGFSAMYRSIQSVSRVKVFCSTVRVGSVFKKFKDLCEGNGDYVSLKWQQHPWNDEEWFLEMQKKAEVDPEVMKELSVDYNVNVQAQYYPETKDAKVVPLEYDPRLPVYVSMDYGSKDLTVFCWYQFNGHDINVIEAYSNRRRDLEWYIPFLNASLLESSEKKFELNESQYSEASLKLIRKLQGWRKPSAYFGEAAHFQKHMPSNRSVADELVKYQIHLLFNKYAMSHEVRRNTTSMMLPRCSFNQDSPWVMELYDALCASRFNNAMRSVSSRETLLKPVHDPEIADFRSCFENGMVNVSRVFKNQRSDLPRGEKGRVDPLTSAVAKYLKV